MVQFTVKKCVFFLIQFFFCFSSYFSFILLHSPSSSSLLLINVARVTAFFDNGKKFFFSYLSFYTHTHKHTLTATDFFLLQYIFLCFFHTTRIISKQRKQQQQPEEQQQLASRSNGSSNNIRSKNKQQKQWAATASAAYRILGKRSAEATSRTTEVIHTLLLFIFLLFCSITISAAISITSSSQELKIMRLLNWTIITYHRRPTMYIHYCGSTVIYFYSFYSYAWPSRTHPPKKKSYLTGNSIFSHHYNARSARKK